MKKWFLFFFVTTFAQISFGQTQQEFEYYIARYKDIAISEMVRCGIPASITLAQGLHESSCGKSPLSREANNHFGIKCKEEWTGKKYYQNDDMPNECFRVYEHAEDSYADHSDFLVTRDRYAGLFKLPMTDYKAWARGLKQCGYATNPKYAEILIKHIEQYHLDELDKQGLALIAEKERLMAYTGGRAREEAPVAVVQAKPVTTAYAAPVIAKPAYGETAVPEQAAPKEAEAKHAFLETLSPESSAGSGEPGRKQYMVNGSLALVATEDEDPLKIAFDYNIDYSYVLQFNDLDAGEHFKAGEYIFLQSKKNRGPGDRYIVQYGESMRDISQKVGMKLRELYTKNLMKPNEQVYAGETLYLQDRRSSAPRTMPYSDFLKIQSSASGTPAVKQPGESIAKNSATDNLTFNSRQYQVQPSDTLYSIARKFNISVEELKNLNNLQTSSLQTGQRLVVSK